MVMVEMEVAVVAINTIQYNTRSYSNRSLLKKGKTNNKENWQTKQFHITK